MSGIWKQRVGGEKKEEEEGNSYLSEPSVCDCLRFSRVIGREWFAVHRSIAKKARADPFLYGSGASGESRLDKQGCQTDVSALWATVCETRYRTFSSRKLARIVCHDHRRPMTKTFQRSKYNRPNNCTLVTFFFLLFTEFAFLARGEFLHFKPDLEKLSRTVSVAIREIIVPQLAAQLRA